MEDWRGYRILARELPDAIYALLAYWTLEAYIFNKSHLIKT
jgi:hypothetical protein